MEAPGIRRSRGSSEWRGRQLQGGAVNYLEVVEEDGGLEESAGAEAGGDGEARLPRDRQPSGGHGLVPGAGAGERSHTSIRQDRLLRRAPSAGGEVPGARVWRIGHWRCRDVGSGE